MGDATEVDNYFSAHETPTQTSTSDALTQLKELVKTERYYLLKATEHFTKTNER